MNSLIDPAVDQTLRLVFGAILPEIALVATAGVLMFLGTSSRARPVSLWTALLGVAAATFLHWWYPPPQDLLPTVTPFLPDAFAGFVRLSALAAAFVLVPLAFHESKTVNPGDHLACLLFALTGLSLVGSANDLLTLFLALELISIPTYVLLYIPKQTSGSQEAAVKYFLLSVLTTGLTLFGFSYLYGITGSLNLVSIAHAMPRLEDTPTGIMALVALVMVLAGVGFRITAVPFHFYAPDVYQGGPTGVVAFLAWVPKLAGFAVLFRLLLGTGLIDGLPFGGQIPTVVWILAAVTMTFGNVLALLQDNLKRLLAYSSIAHGGYMLIGLAVAVNPQVFAASNTLPFHGAEAVLFYLLAYGAMTVGTFAVIGILDNPERPVETVDDLAGLNEDRPGLAFAMAVFLFSLIGLPLTAGFAGKFLLFGAAIAVPEGPYQTMFYVLAVIAAVNAAIAAYYYLRIVGVIYLRPLFQPFSKVRSIPALASVVLCVVATIGLGVYPWPLIEFVTEVLGSEPALIASGG